MDMSLVSAAMGMQAGTVQTQVAAAILKSNMKAERDAVATLLGAAQNSSANLAAGVGGLVDVTA